MVPVHDNLLPGGTGGEPYTIAWDGTAMNVITGYWYIRGAQVCNRRTQIRGGNSVRGRGGGQVLSRQAVRTFLRSVPIGQSTPGPPEIEVRTYNFGQSKVEKRTVKKKTLKDSKMDKDVRH